MTASKFCSGAVLLLYITLRCQLPGAGLCCGFVSDFVLFVTSSFPLLCGEFVVAKAFVFGGKLWN